MVRAVLNLFYILMIHCHLNIHVGSQQKAYGHIEK